MNSQKSEKDPIRERETKYRAIFENSMDAILITAPYGRIFSANPAACKMLGQSESELIRVGRNGVVDLTDERLPGLLSERAGTGKARGELTLLRKDGSPFQAEISSSIFHDINGEASTIMIIRDIAERKQAEETLRLSEEKYRTLFETMLQGAVYQAADGTIISANKSAERILGLTFDQMMGRTSVDPRWKAIHEDGSDFPGDTHPSMMALKTGKEVQNVVMGVFNPQNERYNWINICAVPQFKQGESIPNQVFTTFDDITERKLAEKAMQESIEKYNTLFEHSVVPIWEEDFSEVKKFFDHLRKKRIKDFRSYFRKNPEKVDYCASLIKAIDLNFTSLAFFGVKDKSELILGLPSFFTDDSMVVFTEEMIALAEGKKEFESDIPIKMPDGDIKQLHLRLQIESDHYDTLSKVLVSWIDITDRKKHEEVLKRSSERLRDLTKHIEDARENERTRISLNLHDDLGQKLTTLKMDIFWLKFRIGARSELIDNKFATMIRILDETVRTVQRISSELRPSVLYDLGLVAAIEWQLNEFSRTTGITCASKSLPEDISVDEKLSIVIFRIIQESLTNIARHSEATKVSFKLKSDRTNLKLIIKDNGVGIDQEKIDNPNSFGLIGMRERCKAYGGDTRIEGKKGKGTVITVTIPVGWEAQKATGIRL